MTNGKRNRAAGHNFELLCARLFREVGYPDVVTSRSSNRNRDALKIDLVNRDEVASGRLVWAVQCKNVKGHVKYGQLLEEMPTEVGIKKVVLHKSTKKVNNRFVEQGKYAILYLDDFMDMVKRLKEYESREKKVL